MESGALAELLLSDFRPNRAITNLD